MSDGKGNLLLTNTWAPWREAGRLWSTAERELEAQRTVCAVLPTLRSEQLNPPFRSARSFSMPDALLPLSSCQRSRERQTVTSFPSTDTLTNGMRRCKWLPLWYSEDKHMRVSMLVVMQATACTAPHSACSVECAGVKYHCCASSPKPHANDMLVNVSGGLNVSE